MNARKNKVMLSLWVSEEEARKLFESTRMLEISTIINEAKIRGDLVK